MTFSRTIKRFSCAGLILALAYSAACARAPVPAVPVPTVSPAPACTAPPTPSPMPTPTETPLPTPKIQDEWYAARTEELQKWMLLYGDYGSVEAVDAELAAMEIDPDRPMVALTFDDGPIEGVTDRILDILSRYHVRATFFIRGGRLLKENTAGLLQQILGHGCEIGNHTWQHCILPNVDAKTMLTNLERTNTAVYDATGYTIHTLRPPGGYSSSKVARYAGRYDMAVVLWTQSGNYRERDPEKIAENVQRQIVNGKELEDGDIILLHDTHEWMVDAVALMVPQLLEKGYQLVTVSELLHLSERGFVYGETYKKQN